MDDLINRQAAIDALKEYFNDEDLIETEYGAYWHHLHVLKVLESLPSAQPEIIRCKDCKYWASADGKRGRCCVERYEEDDRYKTYAEEFMDDYCSRAERGEENNA